MVSCAACGLAKTTKTKDQGISFHQFPKGQRGESWAEFVKRNKFEANWAQKATSCLCSRHFNENCFDRTSQLLIRLHPTAILTIIVDRVRYKRCEEEQLLGPTHQQNLMSTPELEPGPSTSTGIEILRSVSGLTPEPEPGPSTSTGIEILPSVSGLSTDEDTPRKRKLKRKIQELSTQDLIKSKRIRKLQKVIWKQKKRIASLKQMTLALKKQSLMKLISIYY